MIYCAEISEDLAQIIYLIRQHAYSYAAILFRTQNLACLFDFFHTERKKQLCINFSLIIEQCATVCNVYLKNVNTHSVHDAATTNQTIHL